MRHDTSKLCTDTLDQHQIVDWLMPNQCTQTGDGACRAMYRVPTCRFHRVGAGVSRMRELVADERTTPTAALRIEEVHESRTDADAREQCSTFLQHCHL